MTNTTKHTARNTASSAQSHGRNPRTYRERLLRRRRILAIGTLVVLLAGILVQAIGAATARAHAGVVTISPANGRTLTTAPKNVTITFNEGVEASVGRVQLLDGNAKAVNATFTLSADGSTVTLTPRRMLPKGLYALRWSVVSADGHVVTGASTFSIATRGTAGKTERLSARSNDGKTLTVTTTTGVGEKTFTINSAKVTGLELRHKNLGATLELAVTGGRAAGILPYPGEWTLTVIERISTYTEERYSAKLSLRN